MTSDFGHRDSSDCSLPRRARIAALLITLAMPALFSSNAARAQSAEAEPATREASVTAAHAQAIDAMLSRYFKPGEPGATVIVARHGTVLFRKAYGMADAQKGTPMQAELALRTGSITKQFTAAAIMLLAEQGKLDVSDEVGKHLPDYPMRGRRVTVEHLLTHTSGIRNYTALAKFGAVMAKEVSVAEGIDFFKDAAPEFQPGQRFVYSNSNYFLLGAIIENVSGMSYPDFMQRHIFQPLQMRSTEIEQDASPVSAVRGHTRNRKGVASVPSYSMSWPYAAGALRTSIDDLARWDGAIRDGALLTAASWERMASDHALSDGSKTGYGYGWFIRKLAGSHAIEHGGDIGGFSADMWRFPKEEIFIAVLGNSDAHDPAPDAIAEKIAKTILRR